MIAAMTAGAYLAGSEAISAGLLAKGGDYSLKDDEDADSLDMIDTQLKFEETLGLVPGFDISKFEDAWAEESPNVRAYYDRLAKEMRFAPDYEGDVHPAVAGAVAQAEKRFKADQAKKTAAA